MYQKQQNTWDGTKKAEKVSIYNSGSTGSYIKKKKEKET